MPLDVPIDYLQRQVQESLDYIRSQDAPDRTIEVSPNRLWSAAIAWKTLAKVASDCSIDSYKQLFAEDFRPLVFAHLPDRGSHFQSVLTCFTTILKLQRSGFWLGEKSQAGLSRLSIILQNPAFRQVVQEESEELSNGSDLLALRWLYDYFTSLDCEHMRNQRNDVAATISSWLCETQQAESYKESLKVLCLRAGAKFLSYVTAQQSLEPKDLRNIIDIQSNTIVHVALALRRDSPTWRPARAACRDLLYLILHDDTKVIAENAVESRQTIERADRPKQISVAKVLWRRVYDDVTLNDVETIAQMTSSIGVIATLEPRSLAAQEELSPLDAAITSVRTKFPDLLHSFSQNGSATLRNYLKSGDVCASIMKFMFSQISNLHDAAFAIAREAFDVVSRADCFSSLLRNLPQAGLASLSSIFRDFQVAADRSPHFGDAARWLVRCTGDVVNALCSQHDGLFNQADFYRGSDHIADVAPEVWRDLWAALNTFFKNAAKWSNAHSRETMVEWMLEAQVLVERLLTDISTFNAACHGHTSAEHLFNVSDEDDDGSETAALLLMVTPTFESILRWLAITDVELLDNTVVLVCRMLTSFEAHGVLVPESTLQRIQGYIECGETGKHRNRLLTEQKNRLKRALSSHMDIDMSLETIEEKAATTKPQVMPSWWNQLKQSPKSVRGFRQPNAIHSIEEDYDLPQDGLSNDELARLLEDAERSASEKQRQKRVLPSTSSVIDSIAALENKAKNEAKRITTAKAAKSFPQADAGLPSISNLRKTFVEERHASRSDAKFGAPPMRNVLPRRTDERIYDEIKDNHLRNSDEEEAPTSRRSNLTKFAPQPAAPRVKQPPEIKRSIKMLDGETVQTFKPGQNAAIMKKRKDERNARLRMSPDMSELYRSLLALDYTHTGDVPATMNLASVRAVPATFADASEYEAVMMPLLLLEIWQQVLRAKEELNPQDRLQSTIVGRLASDEFLVLQINVKTLPRGLLSDTDVVVLHESNNSLSISYDATSRAVICKVDSITRRGDSAEIQLKCFLGQDQRAHGPALHPGSHWILERLFSLTTSLREWAALKSLRYCDLCSHILAPKPNELAGSSAKAIQDCTQSQKVNEPQAKAILGALSSPGISLIQGPPGTGKTKTICALVGAYLSRDKQNKSNGAMKDETLNSISARSNTSRPLLLCAPSNAAVDEVAKRLLAGTYDSFGKRIVPRLVRVGATDAIGINVKGIMLDELVEKEAAANASNKSTSRADNSSVIIELRSKIDSITEQRNEKQAELAESHHATSKLQALDAEVKALTAERIRLYQKLDDEKDKQQSSLRMADALRRRLRLKLLSEAEVICCTLSGSGLADLQQVAEGFETVVIDEAAQCVETSALIPLRYGCTKCIMVGDPKQLPPTVLSQAATGKKYNQSLFVRLMEENMQSVYLLSIQYRMHPSISRFPSKVFYQGRLADGPNMSSITARPWHAESKFPPYALFNVRGKEESGRARSLFNTTEAAVARALYQGLKSHFPTLDLDYRVGIISTYKAQLYELKKVFRQKYGEDILTKIDFNTVDGFQGQEKDIIILSCVRGGIDTGVGFLKDQRRLNVGLTRAKCSLFILGNVLALEKDNFWSQLIQDAKDRGILFNADPQYFFPKPALESPLSSAKKNKRRSSTESKVAAPLASPLPLLKPKDLAASSQTPISNGKNLHHEAAQESRPSHKLIQSDRISQTGLRSDSSMSSAAAAHRDGAQGNGKSGPGSVLVREKGHKMKKSPSGFGQGHDELKSRGSLQQQQQQSDLKQRGKHLPRAHNQGDGLPYHLADDTHTKPALNAKSRGTPIPSPTDTHGAVTAAMQVKLSDRTQPQRVPDRKQAGLFIPKKRPQATPTDRSTSIKKRLTEEISRATH